MTRALDGKPLPQPMARSQRFGWTERRLNDPDAGLYVSVVAQDFVDAYILETGAPYEETLWGARRCPQLGRDLAELARGGVLRRGRTGLQGLAGQGFPRWVWNYRSARRATA